MVKGTVSKAGSVKGFACATGARGVGNGVSITTTNGEGVRLGRDSVGLTIVVEESVDAIVGVIGGGVDGERQPARRIASARRKINSSGFFDRLERLKLFTNVSDDFLNDGIANTRVFHGIVLHTSHYSR